MSKVLRMCLASATALGVPFSSQGSTLDGTTASAIETPAAVVMQSDALIAKVELAAPIAARSKANLMGLQPVALQVLAQKRGAADVFNDMQLKGVVADNRAINVSTGNNLITEGSFAGSAGMPMVVQNSGNNVLIQNATILNIQVK